MASKKDKAIPAKEKKTKFKKGNDDKKATDEDDKDGEPSAKELVKHNADYIRGKPDIRGFFALSETLRMYEYRILGKKGEGTFSEVLKCQNIKDGQYYACKKMKQHYDSLEHVNNLREIQAMRRLSPHGNILELKEVIFEKKSGTLALICELMDMNIYELIRGKRHYLPDAKIKNYMYQLMKSVDHMHRNGIFHRDVKPENILIKDDVLKLADFGSCRSVYSKPPYTEYISTRWYRAPECLLTDGYYSYKMDLWSVGCVIFEVMSLHPLFPGSNEVDQIAKIHDIMGTPDNTILNKLKNKNRGMNFNFPQKKGTGIERLLTHASKDCIELIYQLCKYDPDERISAKQALRHSYFKELRDAEKRAQAMSKIPVKMEDTNKDRPSSANAEVTKPLIPKDIAQMRHRRRRRQKKLADLENAQHNSIFPKVSQAATLHSSTFPSASFPSTFPKLHSNHHHMLPSVANAHYSKHHHHHHKKATNYDTHTKNMYGHYQLPSIDRGKGGF